MRWPRAPGNDGRTRIVLPPDFAPPLRTDSAGDAQPSQAHAATVIARLEGELVGLREALCEARARADGEAARADQLVKALAEVSRQLGEARRPWWRRLRMTR